MRSIKIISAAWRFAASLALVAPLATSIYAAEIRELTDLSYRDAARATTGEAAQCRLDLFLPAKGGGGPSLLWLHGGGLTGGTRRSAATRRVATRLAAAGIAVALADYRLNPTVKFPVYIEDAAAAFAWLHNHIASHGGDPAKVFIGGHSAGAYLALMVALDDRYLVAAGLDESAPAGVVALSGETVTHFTVRAERRSGDDRIVVDDAAPLFHVAKRGFPFLLGFAGHDMALRAEENRLLASALREAGCTVVESFHPDRNHSTILTRMGQPNDAVAAEIVRFVQAPRSSANTGRRSQR